MDSVDLRSDCTYCHQKLLVSSSVKKELNVIHFLNAVCERGLIASAKSIYTGH